MHLFLARAVVSELKPRSTVEFGFPFGRAVIIIPVVCDLLPRVVSLQFGHGVSHVHHPMAWHGGHPVG